jgi:hypothetical protein
MDKSSFFHSYIGYNIWRYTDKRIWRFAGVGVEWQGRRK